MLRSVFGRFRTIFKRTVTTPSVKTLKTSHRIIRPLILLSTVGIVGGATFVALEKASASTLAFKYIKYEHRIATPPMDAWQEVHNFIDLVTKTCPAVVRITCQDTQFGSGFFVDKEGLILTSAHVVGEHKTVTILTTDNKFHQGVVVSLDTEIDLALVRIQGTTTTTTKAFPSLKLGDSSKMRQNDFVMAIGNLLEYRNYVMTGVVSSGAVSSKIITFKNNTTTGGARLCLFPRGMKVIRSNIIAYCGASGSPLIDQNGEAVGVLFTALHLPLHDNSDKETPESCSFFSMTLAVPSNTAKKFLAEAKMKELERIQQATLD